MQFRVRTPLIHLGAAPHMAVPPVLQRRTPVALEWSNSGLDLNSAAPLEYPSTRQQHLPLTKRPLAPRRTSPAYRSPVRPPAQAVHPAAAYHGGAGACCARSLPWDGQPGRSMRQHLRWRDALVLPRCRWRASVVQRAAHEVGVVRGARVQLGVRVLGEPRTDP